MNAMLSNELSALFARDLTRLIQELKAFPDTASLWKTAPGVANAAGTLALHLEGGLRHFIWDTGRGFDLKTIDLLSWGTLAVSTLLTFAIWGPWKDGAL